MAVNIGAQAAGLDGAANVRRLEYTAELGEDPIARCVDDAAAVVGDHGQDDSLVRLEITDGARLVSAHERAVTGDVGCEDRCKTALLTFSHSRKLGLDASAADKLHAQPLRCA